MWEWKSSDYLCHYGIKGMRWGVRRTNLHSDNYRDKLRTIQFFANKASKFKKIRLDKREYAHVLSELATNITEEQKKHDVVKKYIGNYLYSFRNNHDGTYDVIHKL